MVTWSVTIWMGIWLDWLWIGLSWLGFGRYVDDIVESVHLAWVVDWSHGPYLVWNTAQMVIGGIHNDLINKK